MSKDLDAYRLHVLKRLGALTPVFAKASVGDFSENIELPDEDDEFLELYTGVQVMLEVIRDQIAELRELNQELEEKMGMRTAALEEAERIAHLGRWQWDIARNELRWSAEFGRIYRRDPGERSMRFADFRALLPPEERARVEEMLRSALHGQTPVDFDHRLQGPAGEDRWVQFRGSVELDEGGNPVRVVGTGQDITERKRIEEALRKSEEQFRNLVHNARDVIFTLSLDGKIASLNPAFDQVTGWRRQDWIGKPFGALLHPDDLKGATERFMRAVAGEPLPPHEWRIRTRSGEFIFGEMMTTAQVVDGRISGLLGIARDVTERKRAEENLRGLLESAPDGMVIVDEDGKIVLVNTQIERLFGYPRHELLGRTIEILLPETQRRQHATHRDRYSADPHSRPMGEGLDLRGRRKDGREFPVEIMLSPLKVSGGDRVIAAVRDITDRRRAEARVRLLAHTITNMNEAVAITDLRCSIVFVNPAFLETYRYLAREEVLGKNIATLVFADTGQRFADDILKQTLADGWQGEVVHLRKDGSHFPVTLSTSPLPDENGRVVSLVWLSRDITDQVNLRNRLEEVARQREADLSTFAASIQNAEEAERRKIARELHDDFGQRLTGLKFGLEVFKETLPKGGRKLVKSVGDFNRQLTGIVNDLRRLSANLHPAALDDFGLIVAAQHFCREFEKLHGITVDFRTNAGKMTRFGPGVEVALYRILQEALSNVAKHAGATKVTVRIDRNGSALFFDVGDNGRGFDPTRSARPKEGQRGLGLISMRERAEHVGGTFRAESGPETGTTIHVEVPITE